MISPFDKHVLNLKQVRWSPTQAVSELLQTRQIPHGFCGVKATCPSDLRSVNQVHGTEIVASTLEQKADAIADKKADGLWSQTSGDRIAVRTADCLPVLLASTSSSQVAAVHAGWRGFTAGIIPRLFDNASWHPETTIVCIGPAIGREAFEVGPEVVEALWSQPAQLSAVSAALATSKGQRDRWHVDLQLAAVLQLFELGVPPAQIEVIRSCTYSSPESWHSFRREGKGCASNWAWITCS